MTAAALSLADVYTKLNTSRRNDPAERRRYRRVPVGLTGRMMGADGAEHDCRSADISPGDMRVAAAASVKVGDRVVFYLEDLGRLEGHVVRNIAAGEFAVVLSATAHKREKIAELLTWLMSKEIARDIERTPHKHLGAGALASVVPESGPTVEGEVLDFSLVGMAIKTSQPPPALGAWVRIGGIYGRVSRYIEGGFAIDFEQRSSPIPNRSVR